MVVTFNIGTSSYSFSLLRVYIIMFFLQRLLYLLTLKHEYTDFFTVVLQLTPKETLHSESRDY